MMDVENRESFCADAGERDAAGLSEDAGLRDDVYGKLYAAKSSSTVLGLASAETKNVALELMAQALWRNRDIILAANEADVSEAQAQEATGARIDRLRLTEERMAQMMEGLRQLMAQDDPVGDVLETTTRPNGLEIVKVRVPMGVIAMVYEARPNVTVDAAGLAIKTGNAIVLRGGREALRSNQALVAALHEALVEANLPVDAVQLIDRTEHNAVDILIQARGLVNLAIPRGGAGLIQRVVEGARVPVIETGVGNCHVYVDAAADLDKAIPIVVNAKVQRPSVCNAMETLLVHEAVAEEFLPVIMKHLLDNGVYIHACPRTLAVLRQTGDMGARFGASEHRGRDETMAGGRITEALETDFETEYLALELAIKVVASLDDAINHIARYGTQHSESIITEDAEAARRFLSTVDAAVVYHNASTRFTDGFEFGYGAEIGISTQKLHARGPMGIRELTTYKFIVHGHGQVRA